MKRSTIGLFLSLALLAPRVVPAAAQDESPATATTKQRTRKAAKGSPSAAGTKRVHKAVKASDPDAPQALSKGKKRRTSKAAEGADPAAAEASQASPRSTKRRTSKAVEGADPASPEASQATSKLSKRRLRKGTTAVSEPTEPGAETAEDARTSTAPEPFSAPREAPAEAAAALPSERPSTVVLSGDERPWARGVSQQKQQTAIDLFRAANALLKESIFLKAAEQYRQALTHWDHPAIHYNLALALLNLDQPIEVREHLEAAMRYGEAPLDAEKLENARAYKSLVEKQLAWVEITCETPGASVVMDGRPLFVGPGRSAGWVRAGPHTLVATGEGYLTQDQSRTLSPGEKVTLDLKLFTSDDLIQYRRKWSAWKPWAVVGTGVALAAGGALLHAGARSDYTGFDTAIASCGGCVPEPAVANQRTRGDTLQTGAFAAYGVGGAALVTGAVLVYLNRLQPHQVDPSEASKATTSVTPYLGAGGGGASATFRF
ncbi:hypothetical protein [Pyxidicoccus trucidator]|uniref:hypothetical protein n=1 Tax=Pyxidicoccus trucidator TaxID=2709662 RepID=UPI0013D9A040|nr:hypothetical protein [Pyxidicoccus trucidator]